MLLLLAIISSSYAAVRLPVDILQSPREESNLVLQATLWTIAPRAGPVPVSVSLRQDNGIVGISGYGDGRYDHTDAVFGFLGDDATAHNVSISQVICLQEELPGNETGVASAIIGIGHRSALLRSMNSVDFIRDRDEPESRGFLLLNESEATFASENCYEGEVRHIPFALAPFTVSGQILDAVWQLDVIEPSSGAVTTHGAFGYDADSRLHLTTGRMVGVGFPFSVFSTIHSRISSLTAIAGANIDGRYTLHFENCTAVRAALPDIGLNIYNRTGSPIGQILFTPLEYTRLVDGDRCRLLANPASGGSDAFEIDPFQLDGINIRFNRTHVSFCDAL